MNQQAILLIVLTFLGSCADKSPNDLGTKAMSDGRTNGQTQIATLYIGDPAKATLSARVTFVDNKGYSLSRVQVTYTGEAKALLLRGPDIIQEGTADRASNEANSGHSRPTDSSREGTTSQTGDSDSMIIYYSKENESPTLQATRNGYKTTKFTLPSGETATPDGSRALNLTIELPSKDPSQPSNHSTPAHPTHGGSENGSGTTQNPPLNTSASSPAALQVLPNSFSGSNTGSKFSPQSFPQSVASENAAQPSTTTQNAKRPAIKEEPSNDQPVTVLIAVPN